MLILMSFVCIQLYCKTMSLVLCQLVSSGFNWETETREINCKSSQGWFPISTSGLHVHLHPHISTTQTHANVIYAHLPCQHTKMKKKNLNLQNKPTLLCLLDPVVNCRKFFHNFPWELNLQLYCLILPVSSLMEIASTWHWIFSIYISLILVMKITINIETYTALYCQPQQLEEFPSSFRDSTGVDQVHDFDAEKLKNKVISNWVGVLFLLFYFL